MGVLNFALFSTIFLHILKLLNASKFENTNEFEKLYATIIPLNDLIDTVDISKRTNEDNEDNEEIRFEFLDDYLNPLIISKSVKDPTKLNLGFQAKVESKNPIRGGILTNFHLANGDLPFSENKASKELSSEEESIKSLKNSRDPTMEERKKNMTLQVYISDIKDTLKEKFSKPNTQLGLDIDNNVNKIDALAIENRSKGRKNYIRLCRKIPDGLTNLIQKLRGKDCVKLPMSEFYIDSNTRYIKRKKDDSVKVVGLKIDTKIDNKNYRNRSDENKRGGLADSSIVALISNTSSDDDKSKMVDKFETEPIQISDKIANLLREGKLSLTASTALKV